MAATGPKVDEAEDAEESARWGALSYPQFRLYWVSMLARVFGIQFRFIGVAWLVGVEMDRSPIWLGIAGVAVALPTILLSVPAGVVADRFDHQRIIVMSQGLTGVLTLVFALLILANSVNMTIVLSWSIAVGALAALGTPAQSALLPRLIEMRSMPSAVAMVSSVWNSMRIVGGPIAGVLIVALGTGQAFFVSAVGLTISAGMVVFLRPKPLVREVVEGDTGMMEGLRYIFSHQLFLATIGLSFFTSVFGASYVTLLPLVADDVLAVGPGGFGLLEGAAGFGGFIGTFTVIKIGGGRYAGTTMLVSAAVFGLFVAAFAASRDMALAMAFLFAASFAASMYLNLGMIAIQMNVPDYLRGRVMGVWSMTWFLAAVGGLPAAALAEFVGVPWAIAIGALSVTGFAVVVFLASGELRGMRPSESAGEAAG